MLGTQMIHRMSGHGRAEGLFHKSTKFSTPMAIAGMVAAFAGGAVVGMLGHKKAVMSGEGGEGRMWGMGRHHHHGFGYSACRMKHESGELAAPGAVGEKHGERNEGE